VFDNDIAYNDMFGIVSLDSWDNQYYNNTIHHNGDGAMCWGDCEHEVETGYGKDIVFDNYIHDNRGSVFALWSDDTYELEIYGNTFLRNGGNPIHFEQYADHDMKAHLEDWDYNGPSVFVPLEQADRLRFLSIGENTIDGVSVTGSFATVTTDNPGNGPLILIVLIIVLVLAAGIGCFVIYKRKRQA
ncbi:MAG: right-handed parallel beta-helix repeat-containing protein, partial [Dehalococcoidales bacterium]|nr:right-handed parallel beta-helix repeat-containing protein [Dehalococcoidales bacterium]